MKDLLVNEKVLREELEDIEKQAVFLTQKLALLAQEICYIFSQIKVCKKIEYARYYFDLLQEIQDILAKIMYKEKLGLPENLELFVRDFERIDDFSLQEYIFNKIKSNEYYFGKKLD